eukprot:9061645-Alexandrium_andersonii.AAC.1
MFPGVGARACGHVGAWARTHRCPCTWSTRGFAHAACGGAGGWTFELVGGCASLWIAALACRS